jgi:hypothetical protein
VAADEGDRPHQQLIADVEGNFPELTLEVDRRLQLGDAVVVEWFRETHRHPVRWLLPMG